jgi:hypothetical protein
LDAVSSDGHLPDLRKNDSSDSEGNFRQQGLPAHRLSNSIGLLYCAARNKNRNAFEQGPEFKWRENVQKLVKQNRAIQIAIHKSGRLPCTSNDFECRPCSVTAEAPSSSPSFPPFILWNSFASYFH